jgi:RNA polymerase sigma-70 factor (ECF subfamily)
MPQDTGVCLEKEVVAMLPSLKRFARRFLNSATDIDDLAQETVLKMLGHLDTLAPDSNLKSWGFTIMRNTFMTEYKRRQRMQPRSNELELFEAAVSCDQPGHLYYEDVRFAISRLPHFQREALLLIVDGGSYYEAAIEMGCEIGTVKSRVARARVSLAKMLGESSVSAAALAS